MSNKNFLFYALIFIQRSILIISFVFSPLPLFADSSTSQGDTAIYLDSSISDQDYINLTYPDSLDQAVDFLSAAFIAWNPAMAKQDVRTAIYREIREHGIMNGIVKPTLNLIDASYATGFPQFGNLLNPMLNEISPKVAIGLNKKFGLPLNFQDKNFEDVVKENGISGMVHTFQSLLSEGFYTDSSSMAGSIQVDTSKSFFSQFLFGNGSFLEYSMASNLSFNEGTPRGHTFTPPPSQDPLGSRSKSPLPRGLFTNRDMFSYNTCAAECLNDGFKLGVMGATAGGAITNFIPHPIVKAAGPVIGGAIGAGIGLNECRTSKACGGSGEPAPKKNPETKKDNPPPKQNPKPDSAPAPKPNPRPTPKEKYPNESDFDFGPDSPRTRVDDDNNDNFIDDTHTVATPQNPIVKEERNPPRRNPNIPRSKDPIFHINEPKNRRVDFPSSLDPHLKESAPRFRTGYRPPVGYPTRGIK